MKRNVLKNLIEWKNSKDRKPLILEGARQVGKTWVMKELGATEFEDFIYFNFEKNIELKEIFENNKSAARIIEKLSLVANKKILPNKTLIILDEIQECSDALNSLKYFNEDAKDYFVISAGSLLGALLAEPYSYPVGQVNIIKMYPLSFDEFLMATDEALYKIYDSINKDCKIEKIFSSRIIDAYQNYLIIGGMPECVNSWINNHDPQKIDKIQDDLLAIYEKDINKHNKKISSAKILTILHNIVSQLSKENKKFIYAKIQKGSRAKDYEDAISWLYSAGLINIVNCVTKNAYPLKAYDDLGAFKVYFFDTGLLRHMAGIEKEAIILNKDFDFKGALIENYVLQQLNDQFAVKPRYFTFNHFEIDFIIQHNMEIIPIEVKSGNSTNSPSFSSYRKNYSPKISIRYSMLDYHRDGDMVNIPLYLVRKTLDLM